jgi:alkanesulfonate monooxygenase SsuD/methylene tetrahydromethanopterin reductase-like flavin-dependent oxidoreductase (luciferase family)
VDDRTKTLFGIAAPQIHTTFPLDPLEVRAYIQRADELGYHSLWVQEQTGFRAKAGALEAVTLLAYAAALTRKILIGNAVFLINFRNPVLLGKSLASLDQLSAGRLIVAVALGPGGSAYSAYGVAPEQRVARFVEGLTLMQRLWTEESLTFQGKFWQVTKATLLPKPAQKPHPPVWFGGNAPAALARAARMGSGFIAGGSASLGEFTERVEILLRALEQERKDPAEFMIGKRVYLGVDKDSARARSRTREWFGRYYGNPDRADGVAVCGNVDQCVEQLAAIRDAGARLLILSPTFDMGEHLELLAQEVIPKFSNS